MGLAFAAMNFFSTLKNLPGVSLCPSPACRYTLCFVLPGCSPEGTGEEQDRALREVLEPAKSVNAVLYCQPEDRVTMIEWGC